MIEAIGGRTRTRTWDPLIKSQLLYQLSYAPGMPPAVGPQGLRPVAKRVPTVQRRPRGLVSICSVCLKILPSARPRESGDPDLSLDSRFRGNERSSWQALAICGAVLRRKCPSAAHFTTARREFHKRKAAGWGPGGSRTSAIVSGGWECDRRR